MPTGGQVMKVFESLTMPRPSAGRAWLVMVAVTLGGIGAARADIPNFVDFHATWSGGSWTIDKNIHGYDDPTWQTNHLDLKVDNIAVSDFDKEVWVEIEWYTSPPWKPRIDLTQPTTGVTKGVVSPTASKNGFTWQWHLDPQPAEEWIKFPNTLFYHGIQGVKSIEIGTYCKTKTIHKPTVLYGNLDQHNVPDIGDVACGPTSVVNSFVYLEQAYPWHYDRTLVPDADGGNDYDLGELISVAETLAGPKADFDGWKGWELINAKVEYMKDKPDTIFGAQYHWPWPAEAGEKPSWVQDSTDPTWEWIYSQLVKCEDVEIKLDSVPVGDTACHWVTLTSFEWTDDFDGILEEGEAKIDYIDPDDGLRHECNVWLDGGRLRTDYWEVGAWIEAAVSESVPEPAILSLLVVGGLCLLAAAWRRRNAA